MSKELFWTRIGFWFKSAVINAFALFLGLLAGSRFGSIAYSIALASMFDTSKPSRSSFAAASTAGAVVGWIVVTLFCFVALGTAQWLIWNKRDEPFLLFWSIIGTVFLPVGIGLGLLASKLIFPFVATRSCAEYLGFGVGGMVIGIAQWIILRRRVSLVGLCIITNAIALPVGILSFPGITEKHLWLLVAILGITYYAIAYFPLIWLSSKEE